MYRYVKLLIMLIKLIKPIEICKNTNLDFWAKNHCTPCSILDQKWAFWGF